MAPSQRTVVHWLVIPGVSLGVLLLCALFASWFTRSPADSADADTARLPPAPSPAPRAPEVPREPPRVAAPPAQSAPPPVRAPPSRGGPDAPDPRRVEVVEPRVESSSGRIDAEDPRGALLFAGGRHHGVQLPTGNPDVDAGGNCGLEVALTGVQPGQ